MVSMSHHSAECGQRSAACTLWPCKHDLCCVTHSKEVHKCPKCEWPVVKVTRKFQDHPPGEADPEDARGERTDPRKGRKWSTRRRKEKSARKAVAAVVTGGGRSGPPEEEKASADAAEKNGRGGPSDGVENEAADLESGEVVGGGNSVPALAAAAGGEVSANGGTERAADRPEIASATGAGSGGGDGATRGDVEDLAEVGTRCRSGRVDELIHKVEDFERRNREHYKSHIVEHSAVGKIKEREAAKVELVAKLTSHVPKGEEEKEVADMPSEIPTPVSGRERPGMDKKGPGKLSMRRIGLFSSSGGKSQNAPTAA